MKYLLTLASLLALSIGVLGQFSVETHDYEGEVTTDVSFTDHNVYIYNELGDSLYLGWKMVENTCPDEWSYVLCDYGFCYDGLPLSGTMQPVPAQADAFLKLSVFANETEGAGYIRFWVYESDNQQDYETITFWFNTPVGVEEESATVTGLWPNPAGDEVRLLTQDANAHVRILNLAGQCVYQQSCAQPGTHTLNIAHLSPGPYVAEIASARRVETIRLQHYR